MNQKQLFDSQSIHITLQRLCYEIIENYDDLASLALVGIQKSGVFLAEHINEELECITGVKVPLGDLDITFYRDDFRRKPYLLKPSSTRIDFVVENQNIILIDDVLYTGRSIDAALRAILAFGRPKQVEVLVLVNRRYSRELPIEPKYVGRDVNTIQSQQVIVQLEKQGFKKNNIALGF